jgi:hypothetical protein
MSPKVLGAMVLPASTGKKQTLKIATSKGQLLKKSTLCLTVSL